MAAAASARDLSDDTFAAHPPTVETLQIQALDRGESGIVPTLLDVRYAKNQSLPPTIPIVIDGREISLKRDSDDPNHYTAQIMFDIESLIDEQKLRREESEAIPRIKVFDGRRVVADTPIKFMDPELLRKEFASMRPVRIPPDIFDPPAALISAPHSLLVNTQSVVEDPTRTFDPCTGVGNPNGAWTFNTLMTNIANPSLTGIDPAVFVEKWMATWDNATTVNTFSVLQRPAVITQILDQWPRLGDGRLNLKKSPMRLLAIVNRIDLRKNSTYGGDGGEGRFVFGVLDPNTCAQRQFTVILEYGLPFHQCSEIRDFGTQWKDLDTLTLGSVAYNAALQAITDQFTGANAEPSKPNGSAINQVRSNEFLNSPWELREFHLPTAGGFLKLAPTVLTPHRATYNIGGPLNANLATFINTNAADILADDYDVPLTFLGDPFLTGTALNPNIAPSGAWQAPGISLNDARNQFSLNTCDACHGSETQTQFLHIRPRNLGSESLVSQFLAGTGTVTSPTTFTMPDPVVTSTTREYGDLVRRQADLDMLVGSSCHGSGVLADLMSVRAMVRTH